MKIVIEDSRKYDKIAGWIFIGVGSFFILPLILFPDNIDIGFAIGFSIVPSICIIIGIYRLIRARKTKKLEEETRLNGKKRICKIYELVNSKSYIINGVPAINILLRFVDENGVIREHLCYTEINPQRCPYYRGLTINAYEYQGDFMIDEKSVREEILPRENELMSEKPLYMSDASERTTQTCRVCGAVYPIVKGITNKCPYCGTYDN